MTIKSTAMKLCPGGRPDFTAIFDDEKTSQISAWSKRYGRLEVAKLTVVLLEDLNNYFNVARPMNTNQITDLAIEIVSELWFFRMEELLALFEAIKKQTYGKVYERLDPAVIWEHIQKHNEAREEFFYARAQQHKQSDPIVEPESDKVGRGLNTLSGSIARIRDTFKIEGPKNGKG